MHGRDCVQGELNTLSFGLQLTAKQAFTRNLCHMQGCCACHTNPVLKCASLHEQGHSQCLSYVFLT